MKQKNTFLKSLTYFVALFVAIFALNSSLQAASATKLEKDSESALQNLYKNNKTASALSKKAEGILIFPNMDKVAFIIGMQRGDGVLFEKGKVAGFYNSTSVSAGWQAGVRQAGYALFFMDDKSLESFKKSSGFSLGTQPNMTVIDQGFQAGLSTMNFDKGIKAFFFDAKGLMAGIGLHGTKITKYDPSQN
jgi:lipid-binding SYLF domain-containing protein